MPVRPPIPELLKFLSAYDDRVVQLALATRRLVLTAAPGASEGIYDAYNAVAIGYSFTGRLKESFCHVAVYSRHVNLGFNRGIDLPDTKNILQGSGNQVRHVTIKDPQDLRNPALKRLLRLAIQNAHVLAASTKIAEIPAQSVVKAIYPKKRRPPKV